LYLSWRGESFPARVGGGARAVRHGPRTSRSRRVVVRGGDLSCEAETCRGDPSCRELVEEAANWTKSGRLASVDLDQGP
jgi:hypothetical protein